MNDQLHQTDDIFTWKDISILQKEDVFKVGTDALLLGAWVPKILQNAKSILDIGCGTGVLSQIMHRAFPEALIVAIDYEPAAVELSNLNFSNAERPELLSARVHDVFSFDLHTKFDLIVCNPPYFFGPNHMHQGPYSGARHARDNPEKWMQKIASLISTEGHICLVLPHSAINAWIKGGNDHGLYMSHSMKVYSFNNDKEPKRALLHFTTNLCKPVFEQIVIYISEDQYSDEYKNLVSGDNLS